jgi:quercetin dioxygenase-like cupin family protein
MYPVDLKSLKLTSFESVLDPARRMRVSFPTSSATGAAASASVYFELEPGAHLGVHSDSAEELLVVLDGTAEALIGDEVVRVEAGQILVVPAMVCHDVTNVGASTLHVLGTFAASTVVSTCEEPLAPAGPQVFVIGAPIPIGLPLSAVPA